jgi:hypothetical protein
MKRLSLAAMMCFSLGCINVAYADFWGRLAHTVGNAWEDTKRETTNVAHNTEKTIEKAWEDTKRESTNFAKSDTGKVVEGLAVAGAAVTVGDYGQALEIIKEIAKVY